MLLSYPADGRVDKRDKSIVIAIFLGVDCPISQKYVTRLNDIYLRYRNERALQWRFIVPRSTKREINIFIKEYGVQFPVERDNTALRKTKSFNASITPEVVIVKNNETLYQGAIDNWFYALGRNRLHTTENYLIDAIVTILKDDKPTPATTNAIGCFIQMKKRNNGKE
jgi:hypothetical protein